MTDFETLLQNLIDSTAATADRHHRVIEAFDRALLDNDRVTIDRLRHLISNHDTRRNQMRELVDEFKDRFLYGPASSTAALEQYPDEDEYYEDEIEPPNNPHGITYRTDAAE